MALGGLTDGVTNMELTAAYATIANGGQYIKPRLYTKIIDHDGNDLIVNTDTHSPENLITFERSKIVAMGAGLSEKEALKAIIDNPQKLLNRI